MGHHDVGGGLFVQLLPVALVGGGDGNVTRTVALPAILYHEHHLPGFAGEPPFGPAHQLTPESWKELSSRLMFQQSVLYAMAETFMPAM